MAGNLNKVQLIGRLGRDPESRQFSNGGSVVTFPLATSESWKDRDTGERREKTDWHRIAIFSEGLKRIATSFLRKGDQVYLEGRLETRKFTDSEGRERFMTEVVLRPYNSSMEMLGGRRETTAPQERQAPRSSSPRAAPPEEPPDLYRGAGMRAGFWPDDEAPF